MESVQLLARLLPCACMSSKVESLLCLSVCKFVRGHRDEWFGQNRDTCSLFLLWRSYKWNLSVMARWATVKQH